MNNTNKKTGRKPADAMKIGAIIAIIGSALAIVFGLLFSIIMLLISNYFVNLWPNNENVPHIQAMAYNIPIFTLVFSLLNIPTIILNTMLLKGKLNNSIVSGIFAIISLGVVIVGIIAAILIFTGKFQDQINPENHEDFLNQNFNVPQWEPKNKSQTIDGRRNNPKTKTTIVPIKTEIVANKNKTNKKQ